MTDLSGEEMRIAVAISVGWYRDTSGRDGFVKHPGNITIYIFDELPHYESDIAAAWGLVEKMRGYAIEFEIQDFREDHEWEAMFVDGPDVYSSVSASAPEAICRCFLEAVRAGVTR